MSFRLTALYIVIFCCWTAVFYISQFKRFHIKPSSDFCYTLYNLCSSSALMWFILWFRMWSFKSSLLPQSAVQTKLWWRKWNRSSDLYLNVSWSFHSDQFIISGILSCYCADLLTSQWSFYYNKCVVCNFLTFYIVCKGWCAATP